MTPENVTMIKTIAGGLDEILNDFVFVGGVIMELYADDISADKPRLTNDVDVVVEAASHALYDEIEKKLRKKGFINDIHGPACRMIYKNVKLDVITTVQSSGGFTNIWYEDGFRNSITKKIDDIGIRIFPVEYFIASKLEAFKDRGKYKMIGSHDFEDIIYVIDGRQNIKEDLQNADEKVLNYLRYEFKQLLNNSSFPEGVAANLGYQAFTERIDRIINIYEFISNK